MRKLALSLTVTVAACCLQEAALAQNDSSRLDAGAITFKREFTQNLRIKGEDLEKMPFANLGEAINAWLYDAYTSPPYIVYVVDGNVLSDVNAYSVYDIEEVVLVQHAAAMIQMAAGQQQLVLITTRKGGKGKSGIKAGAQTGLVNQSASHSNLYQQYYVGAYRNLGKISMGLSADYLRDVYPIVQSDNIKTITPYNLDRLRLHGYLSIQLGNSNKVEFHVNYTPQWLDSASTAPMYQSVYRNEGHARQHLFMPWARWHSDLLPGLKNDLQAGYTSTLYNADLAENDIHPGSGVAGSPLSSQVKGNAHADHLFLRDRLGANIDAGGGWTFEPALNISYEHLSRRTNQSTLNISNGGLPYASSGTSGYKQGLIFLTPAAELSYRSLLHIQGGVLADLSDYHGYKPRHRYYPFASVSFDLLRLAAPGNASRLQLFGSYAKTAPGTGGDYLLTDLSGNNNVFSSITPLGGFFGTTAYPQAPFYFASVPPSNFWIWEAGAEFALPGDRFSVSYNFERRNFLTLAVTPIPQGPNGVVYVYTYPEWKSSLHRLGIQWKVFDREDLRWQTGLNATILRSKTFIGPGEIFQLPMGDYNTDHPSWTGGWVNRLEYKGFLAGADLLYHFGEQVMLDPASGSTERVNSFRLQHVYAGYRVRLSRERLLELYFNSRSLYNSNRSIPADRRRYYGVGGKLNI